MQETMQGISDLAPSLGRQVRPIGLGKETRSFDMKTADLDLRLGMKWFCNSCIDNTGTISNKNRVILSRSIQLLLQA